MERIYDRAAAAVSPVLVDIEAAYHSNRIPEMMDFVAACNPKFHVSFINTQVSFKEMAAHLRRVIYFVNEEGREFTLRFADGAVSLVLSKILTPGQLSRFYGPVMNWRVHNRENQLTLLHAPTGEVEASLPLVLSTWQMSQLKEEMKIYQLLANIRRNHPVVKKNVDFAAEYEWIRSAMDLWSVSGRNDNITLWIFMKGVIDTNGGLLRAPSLSKILSSPDLNQIKAELRKVISSYL